MLSYDNCPNCFMPLKGSTVCPSCGNDYSKNKQFPGVLPVFSVLNNKYLVGRVLGKGGFGITYVAKDLQRNMICAIKEYMPSEYASRTQGSNDIVPFSDDKAKYVFNHGREKFIDEARTLVKLRNDPVVVDILDFFSQNNTAYLVMEFLDGEDLRKRARQSGGVLDPEFAKQVFVTIASSLMEIHKKNILHRDLSPENIIVTRDGRIKLIDFGAARNFVSTQNKGMSILLKPGFAPPEQYNAKGAQGPWSDVYALCATFYNLVSGKPLVDALFRYRGEVQPSLASMGCPVTKKTSEVIERGMELDHKRRYQDFGELLNDIDISAAPAPRPQPPQQPGGHPQQPGGHPQQPGGYPQQPGGHPQQPGGYPQQPAGYPHPPRPVQTPQPPRPPQPAYHPQPPVTPTAYSQIPATVQSVRGNVQMQNQQSGPRPYIAAIVGNSLCNKVFIGTNDVLKIGRSAQSCQYVVSGDSNISRIHCYLRYDGNRIYISDASSNGTFFADGTQLIKNKEYVITPNSKFYLATKNHMFVLMV